MKVYEAIFDESVSEGVFGISLVENPAMEDHWVTLSEQKQEIQFSAVNDEKQLLLGAVLIPNKKVYRKVDDKEFFITFTSDTIGKLAHNFLRKGHQNSSSKEHEIKLDGVSFVESWQVDDPKVDKSALYGKQYEKGTWVTMAHVSKDIYEDAKNGIYKGFSIDGLLQLQEINFKSEIKMENETSKSIIDAIKEGFKTAFGKQAEKVEEVELEANIDIDAFKTAITEVLAQFKEDSDAKFEAFKAEFTKMVEAKTEEVEAKEKEIDALKVELNKQPEAEAIRTKPLKEDYTLENNRLETTRSRVMKNLAKNVWN